MLQPIYKVDEGINTENGYFYDRLHNDFYYVKDGKIQKKNKHGDVISINLKFNLFKNTHKIFPRLIKVKGNCKFNVEKTIFTN